MFLALLQTYNVVSYIELLFILPFHFVHLLCGAIPVKETTKGKSLVTGFQQSAFRTVKKFTAQKQTVTNSTQVPRRCAAWFLLCRKAYTCLPCLLGGLLCKTGDNCIACENISVSCTCIVACNFAQCYIMSHGTPSCSLIHANAWNSCYNI